MTDRDEPEQTAVNDSGTALVIDARLTQLRSLGVHGWTYFIQRTDGAIKIGFSMKPKQRIRGIAREFGVLKTLAVVPACLFGEYETHQLFGHLRLDGEWFRSEPELFYFIEQAKADADAAPDTVTAPPPARAKQVKRAPSHHQQAIRQIINARAKSYDADSPIGHTLSNLAVMLKNMETYVRPAWATHESQTLPYSINRMRQRLELLTAQ